MRAARTQTRGPASYDGVVHAERGCLVDGTGQPLLLWDAGPGTRLGPAGCFGRRPSSSPSDARMASLTMVTSSLNRTAAGGPVRRAARNARERRREHRRRQRSDSDGVRRHKTCSAVMSALSYRRPCRRPSNTLLLWSSARQVSAAPGCPQPQRGPRPAPTRVGRRRSPC